MPYATRRYASRGLLLLTMVLAAFLADVVAPFDPTQQHLTERLQPPSATYLLGTDQFGRDLLSRILFGARTSLYVGVGVVLIGTTAATILGAISAYAGGRFDQHGLAELSSYHDFIPISSHPGVRDQPSGRSCL